MDFVWLLLSRRGGPHWKRGNRALQSWSSSTQTIPIAKAPWAVARQIRRASDVSTKSQVTLRFCSRSGSSEVSQRYRGRHLSFCTVRQADLPLGSFSVSCRLSLVSGRASVMKQTSSQLPANVVASIVGRGCSRAAADTCVLRGLQRVVQGGPRKTL